MNCRTAEEMINRYINHTLSVNDLELFLEHIESCSACYDELATHFIVHEAMKQLNDTEEDQIMDFRNLLEEDIAKSRHYIRRQKLYKAVTVFAICLVISVLAVFLAFIVLELKGGL